MTILLAVVLGLAGAVWVVSGIHAFLWCVYRLIRNVIEGL